MFVNTEKVTNITKEYIVNEWLDKTINGNNGPLKIYDDTNNKIHYRNFHYCNEFYYMIHNFLKSKGYDIIDDDVFRDKLTYIIYKFSLHE